MKRFPAWLFIAVVTLLPITAIAIVKWYQNKYTPLPVLAGKAHRIADFRLTSQYNNAVSLKNWEGKIVVANFFFTHCPVICPKMVRNLKKVQGVYINDTEVLFNSFTVDPERDSVGQLRRYADRMNIRGSWLLLTGDKKEIYKLARKSFLVTATDGDGGSQDFIHSDMLVLIDGQKSIRGYYAGTDEKEANRLIGDIEKLKKE